MILLPIRSTLLLACVTLLSACAQFELYRPIVGFDNVCHLPDPDAVDLSKLDGCRNAAVETVDYQVGDKKAPFEIAYIEFTDQGWLQKRSQLEQAFDLLNKTDSKPLQVVVFIHGWKHSADADDRDLKHFRSTILPAFAKIGTNTVGIYAAWRGESIPIEGVNNITFYDRKFSAEHVARGSIRELLSRLRALRSFGKTGNSRKDVKVVLIGHSFGGLILYNAIAGSLLDTLVDTNFGAAPKDPVSPIVDLAIVLNPAFEASRFEPLFQVAKQRLSNGGGYPQVQQPIFVSITSESDSATKTAFPLGRAINSSLEHEGGTDEDCPSEEGRKLLDEGKWCSNADYTTRLEKVANTNTIGHMPRYYTHFLSATKNGLESNSSAVSCTINEESGLIKRGNSQFPLWTMFAEGSNPIEGHSGIYKPELWKFIASLADGQGNTICK